MNGGGGVLGRGILAGSRTTSESTTRPVRGLGLIGESGGEEGEISEEEGTRGVLRESLVEGEGGGVKILVRRRAEVGERGTVVRDWM